MHATAKWMLGAITALVLSSSAVAQEPKPDLASLRDAVNAASKRGNNLIEVEKALDALAKVLAKNTPKAGATAETPTELTALREAVERAGSRGEDVETIRKELAALEVAITGKAYQRPKPEPPPEPSFPPERRFGRRGGGIVEGGGRVIIRGGGGIVIRGAQLGGRSGISITISGNEFTIRATQGDVKYELRGAIGEDGPILDEVTITEGEKKPVEVKKLKDVPDEHKPAVEKLLKTISRG